MDVKNRRDYVAFLQESIDALKDDPFYNAFQNYLSRGKNSLTIYRKQNQKMLDRTWIDIVEDTIINFDNRVRDPFKYIEREEEIVPVELAHEITTESVKYLAQHTNTIAEVKGEDITPNKLLTIHKEETLNVYENRFVYTTLLKAKEFVDKRAKAILDSSGENNIINVNLESMFKYGDKALDFSIKLKSKSANSDNQEENEQLQKDISRVEKMQTIINTFCNSKFAKEMSRFALVRPPITRTNKILKNPDCKKILALWQFINTYEKLGYEIHSTETLEDISKQSYDSLSDNIFLNYLFYYNMILLNTPQEKVVRKSKYSPRFVRKFLENVVSSGDLEDVELQNVVHMSTVPKKDELSMKQQKAILLAIDKGLAEDEIFIREKEEARIKAEKDRAERIERLKVEKEKKKQIEEARKARIKARELAKKEKEKERIRLAKEAELARLHEIAKRKKVEELRIKLFRKAFKIDQLVELARLKARLMQDNPDHKLEQDKDVEGLDPKVRAKLIEVVKKALDIKLQEKGASRASSQTPQPVNADNTLNQEPVENANVDNTPNTLDESKGVDDSVIANKSEGVKLNNQETENSDSTGVEFVDGDAFMSVEETKEDDDSNI